eukprot:CAMPEP_0183716690 /NCGR_PEP_ID=MMETSP0737-20130205/10498_1 /TAXON_ID=385413 /ORGANISM="Thalassiosira miniscula, Strain CCMP1093" /LENGTH=1455 /DNA_ID=CAMNT_0025945985 /DNA_START=64 /DNA_END=4431 /DNA_ORIENTATION=-
MSDVSKEAPAPVAPEPVLSTNNVLTTGSSSPISNEVVDLTLSDSEDDDNDNAANTMKSPSPTSVIAHPHSSGTGQQQQRQQQVQVRGDYTKFSKYATSLRKRGNLKRSFADDSDVEGVEDADAVADAPPNIVTPKKMKRAPSVSSSSVSSSSSSSSSVEASSSSMLPLPRSCNDDDPETTSSSSSMIGHIGYKFHKWFFVDGNKEKKIWFHGEVVGILGGATARNGKDRHCVFHDGDVELMSLMELRGHPRCTDTNCELLASGEGDGMDLDTSSERQDEFKEEDGMSVFSDISDQDSNPTSARNFGEDVDGVVLDENQSIKGDADCSKTSSVEGPNDNAKDGRKTPPKGDSDPLVLLKEAEDHDSVIAADGKSKETSQFFSCNNDNQDDSSIDTEAPHSDDEMATKIDAFLRSRCSIHQGNSKTLSETMLEDDHQTEQTSDDSNTSLLGEDSSEDDNDDVELTFSEEHVTVSVGQKEENSDNASSDDEMSLFPSEDDNDDVVNTSPEEPSGMTISSNPAEAPVRGSKKASRLDPNASHANHDDGNSVKSDQAFQKRSTCEGNNAAGASPESDDEEDLFDSSGDEEDLPAATNTMKSKERFPMKNTCGGNDSSQASSESDDDEEDLFDSSDDEEDLFAASDTNHDDGRHEDSDDDTDLFASSDDNDHEEEDDEFDEQSRYYSNVRYPDEDDDDNDSRFSDGDDDNITVGMDHSSRTQQLERPRNVVVARAWGSTLVTEYTPPTIEVEKAECYYFAILWGNRMLVRERPTGLGLPPTSIRKNGMKYKLLFNELITRKSKGPVVEGIGNKYKAYYLAVSGHGLKRIDLKSALLRIGDFESLTYEKGAHKTISRLKLLVSPCCRPPGGDMVFSMRRLHKNRVEIIEENGHMGCGFIPRSLLLEILGKTNDIDSKASAGAKRVFAIQVRIIGPSTIGVAKGMLVAKDGINAIQVPSSMIKVEKSKTDPMHDDVVLNVHKCFPWNSHWIMGRLINNDPNVPSKKQKEGLKAVCSDVMRVFQSKGIPTDVLRKYDEDFDQQIRFNHANLIGVIDPTGLVSSGCVFLPGMGEKTPSKVFLTRNPCTEGRDGIVAEVASLRDMPIDAVEFFESLGFGSVVFALGDELPSRINDGDLDGDNFFCLWDEEVLEYVTKEHDIEDYDIEIQCDGLVGSEFNYYDPIKDKHYPAEVVQKLQVNPDKYLVAIKKETIKKNEQKEMTKEALSEMTDYMTDVFGHRLKGKGKQAKVQFDCQWWSGERGWIDTNYILDRHKGTPQALKDYAQAKCLLNNKELPKKFCKWINDNMDEVDIKKITHHKKLRGDIHVCCRYTNGEEKWLPIEEAKKDCKVFLGAYAKENNLFGQPGWEKIDGYWLKEVHDEMSRVRSNEINRLTSQLHSMWKKSFDDENVGANHQDTIIWGRAYKRSLEIEKHGGFLKLPCHLYKELKPNQKKYVEALTSEENFLV